MLEDVLSLQSVIKRILSKKTASKSSGFGGLFRDFSEGTTKMMLFQYYEQIFGRFQSGFQADDTEIRAKK